MHRPKKVNENMHVRHARNLLFAAFLAFAPTLLAEKVPGRYIVELTTAPVADQMSRVSVRARLQTGTALAHRARVQTEQRRVRQQLEQRQARVLGSVDTVANALFVEISDAAAAQLASTPGVKRVVPVRTFQMLLDRAVLLHKAAEAWEQVGIDHAGEGAKIAIIDSGIDINHPGFTDPAMTRARVLSARRQ